ncbi:MAG: extracellular solute-binding protein [Clostridia bacterium]|nr:extracellular solute-binding protein [Clostridia bacterium]
MKRLALIPASLLLSALLLACGSTSDDGTTTENSAVTTAPLTEADTTEPAEPAPDLPDMDYDGADFTLLNGNMSEWMMIYTVTAAEETGDSLNDAIYQRNRAVEEQFNVKIVEVNDTNAHTMAKKAVAAGDSNYDILLTVKANALDLVLQNYLIDYADIPHIDTDASWWVQGSMTSMSIGNRVFYGISLFDTTHYDGVRTIYFNKTLIDAYDLESPYDLVLSGKWTIDKMLEMGLTVAKDVDGDGKWGENDMYGYNTWDSVGGQTLMTGCGASLSVHKDENDMPYFDMNTDYYIERLEKVTDMLAQDGFYNTFATSPNNGGVAYFKAGNSLFYNETMGNAQKLREMTLDFGIIPGPKYNEEQESYYNCGGNPYFMCVLTTNADLDRTGMVMEALAYESVDTVKVAAYDEMLEGKVSRDDDSEAMLDIIYSTLVYDHPIAISTINGTITANYLFKNKKEYASYFTKNETKIQKEIDKYIEAYNGIE